MKFKKWLNLVEMGHFSIPNQIIIPCKSLETSLKLPCIDKMIGSIDMRFEDPGAYPPPYNKLTNFSKFIVPIPKSNNFIVYHGPVQRETELITKEKAIEQKFLPVDQNKNIDLTPGAISELGYYLIPKNWFTNAQVFDKDYNIIKPALADINGIRALKTM